MPTETQERLTRIVGIDSMVLIYALTNPPAKSTATKFKDNLVLRARVLLKELAEDRAQIVLPSIAIAELLVPVPAANKGLLIAELAKQFVCKPFDLPAAAIASDLWARYKQLPQNRQYNKRDVMKADAMIVATAKAAGATEFYSHDHKCRDMAGLIMKAFDLPTTPGGLFTETEIQEEQDNNG